MLERELGGRRELEALGVAQRALREGREPADRLDLVAEQLDPRGALLGRREDVEDPAADRELPALVHLVGALVTGSTRSSATSGRSISSPRRDVNPDGRSEASGIASASATGARHHHGGRLRRPASASSAAMRSPTRCGGGVRCEA